MSKGIGAQQRLILVAMLDLEAEHGPCAFHVWAILNAAFARSPELQRRREQARAAIEERDRELRAEADAGDKLAAQIMTLGAFLRAGTRRRQRPWAKRRDRGANIEDTNPSRALTGLERRGLIKRGGRQGYAHAALTDAGREAGQRARSVHCPLL
jgi:hypothetical protein